MASTPIRGTIEDRPHRCYRCGVIRVLKDVVDHDYGPGQPRRQWRCQVCQWSTPTYTAWDEA